MGSSTHCGRHHSLVGILDCANGERKWAAPAWWVKINPFFFRLGLSGCFITATGRIKMAGFHYFACGYPVFPTSLKKKKATVSSPGGLGTIAKCIWLHVSGHGSGLSALFYVVSLPLRLSAHAHHVVLILYLCTRFSREVWDLQLHSLILFWLVGVFWDFISILGKNLQFLDKQTSKDLAAIWDETALTLFFKLNIADILTL